MYIGLWKKLLILRTYDARARNYHHIFKSLVFSCFSRQDVSFLTLISFALDSYYIWYSIA